MAFSAAVKEAKCLKNLLNKLGFTQSDLTTVGCENKGSISIASKPHTSDSSKHIAIWHHFVRDAVDNPIVKRKFVPSNLLVADGLTEPIAIQKMQSFVGDLCLY